MAPVEHVVADAGAFLGGAPLQEIGRQLYTVREVVAEIRDKEARRRLALLPRRLRFKQPGPEYVRLVTEFAKKTGDYPSLSATDLQVLALTYQLEAEHVGAAHLRKEPGQKVTLCTTNQHPEAPIHLAGFHLPSKAKCQESEESPSVVAGQEPPGSPRAEDAAFGSFVFWRPPLPTIEEDLRELLKAAAGSLEPKGQESAEEDGSEEEEEGWITPSNIRQVQQAVGRGADEPVGVQVACLTTDFAMQNVLLQMGLHVLAVNGLLIHHTRSYILRCHGCFRTTSEMTRLFCPHCGNKTLKKVAVTVDSEGNLHMHFSRNPKVLNPRGLRYSLPLPQGGKHASNPHLVDDQRFPQQRLSHKAKQKTNVFDPDYLAGAAPFVENDIYSRAAHLQIRDGVVGAGRRRLNPNASTKKFARKR